MKAHYCVAQSGLQRRPSMTKNRKQVMALLQTKNSAMSAYEVIAAMAQEYDVSLHPMAAYRALDFLLQMRCVLHLRTINKFLYIDGQQHCFWRILICDSCQQIEKHPLPLSIARPMLQHAGSAFQTKDLHIELHGLCENCCDLTDT